MQVSHNIGLWTCLLTMVTNWSADYRTEQYVGIALRESGLARSDFFITTKFSGGGEAPDAINDSIEKVSMC